ncbi:hypothetical protein CDD82_3194 [Ophiocordyceps australis]|uniref:Uncharacterized protein n=1 Tax=Ophiocordyceps australis TaxID=1399860 RepID=A0A2C5ZFZ6_9HYPO|nr:hypothetical protein CDD82_3194 [Ophiocordyceps australis]
MYTLTALVLLAAWAAAIPMRPPFLRETSPGAIIMDQAYQGISRLGPAGGLRADKMFPKGGGMPFKSLPGGLPELAHPPSKFPAPPGKQSVGVGSAPGTPLGPRKKTGVVENLPPWSADGLEPHFPSPPPSPHITSSLTRPLDFPLREKPMHSKYLEGKYP